MKYGVDSSHARINTKRVDALTALIGEAPAWWARYLGNADEKTDATDTAQSPSLHPVKELPVLKAAGVRCVPVSRRSNQVCRGTLDGVDAATQDLVWLRQAIEAPAGDVVLPWVFLDVENTPDLNSFFYEGWANTLTAAGYTPAIYMPNFRWHPNSWKALKDAVARGARCGGTWAAWYDRQSAAAVDSGASSFIPCAEWDQGKGGGPVGPNLAWQYEGNALNKQYDFSCNNPAAGEWWLDKPVVCQ